jgi:hypothetical protein
MERIRSSKYITGRNGEYVFLIQIDRDEKSFIGRGSSTHESTRGFDLELRVPADTENAVCKELLSNLQEMVACQLCESIRDLRSGTT